jgi:hypothetical protein
MKELILIVAQGISDHFPTDNTKMSLLLISAKIINATILSDP